MVQRSPQILLVLFLAALASCSPEVSLGSQREPSSAPNPRDDAATPNLDATTESGAPLEDGVDAGPIACFAPDRDLDLAYDPRAIGCACAVASRFCVRLERPDWLAIECIDGRWRRRLDDNCGAGPLASCDVNGVVYAHGSPIVESPFDCNFCFCADGFLACSQLGCPLRCGPGTAPGVECLACGPDDICTVRRSACVETCRSDADCIEPGRTRCDLPRGLCTDALGCR